MSTPRRSSRLAPEYPLLGFIIRQPSHGYRLHQRLQQELGELWRISLSQTYSILKRLEEQGFVEGSDLPQETGPDRYDLQATESGRAHFRRWVLSPSGIAAQALRVEFLTRLYFARQESDEMAIKVIDGQVTAIQNGLKQLQERQPVQSRSSQVNEWALHLRIRQLESMLDWLKQMEQKLIHSHSRQGELKSQ